MLEKHGGKKKAVISENSESVRNANNKVKGKRELQRVGVKTIE